MITVVLADDHTIVRQGLRALLASEPDLTVTGEAIDGPQAIQLVERLRPNVLVLDLMMPGLSGLKVTREIRQSSPQTRVVILSMHANQAYVLEALQAGAVAYVLKESTASDLAHAIREAVAGRRFISPPLSEQDIEVYMRKAKIAPATGFETLTRREREVLRLAAEGQTSTEIAEILSISPRTVEIHRANMMHKMGLRTQADLIRYALRHGILHLDD
jgi:DNA-binding NarL/FixJ family response regulator